MSGLILIQTATDGFPERKVDFGEEKSSEDKKNPRLQRVKNLMKIGMANREWSDFGLHCLLRFVLYLGYNGIC